MQSNTINKYILISLLIKLNNFNVESYNYNNYNYKINNKNNNLLKLDKYLINKKNLSQITLFRFYQLFNLVYLQNIFKISLKEKNINSLNILPYKLTKIVLFKVRNVSFKQFKIKYFNEVAHIFLINIWLKNLKNLCKYIKKKLDTVHFKKHRFYFLFFFKILNKYIRPNFQELQIKGIYLVFRGKLGQGGNSRKKTMFFKRGYYSLSNKLLALNTQKWDIWTKTGSVGCTMRIFYNKYDNFFKYVYNFLLPYINKTKLFTFK